MNKELILNSNKYKSLKENKKHTIIVLIVVFLVGLVLLTTRMKDFRLFLLLIYMMIPLLVFIPMIIYYHFKANQLLKHSETFKKYQGNIIKLETKVYRSGGHRNIIINSNNFNEPLKTKINLGELYGEIHKNAKVSFLYSEVIKEIVVLEVIKNNIE